MKTKLQSGDFLKDLRDGELYCVIDSAGRITTCYWEDRTSWPKQGKLEMYFTKKEINEHFIWLGTMIDLR